jgi:peptidoglycan/LPS O-acetylase OafA/YrhL
VDIFFVISGFVITRNLWSSMQSDRFSVLDFYDRRIRRIFPAMAVMLLATLVAAVLILFPDDLAKFGLNFAGAAMSLANVTTWNQTGYFVSSPETSPLLHMWTLSIEDQFYLAFPFILMLLYRHSPRYATVGIVAICCGSFAACLWGTFYLLDLNFFSAPMRAWEFMLGSVLAVRAQSPVISRLGRELLSLGGLALIIAGLALIDDYRRAFPGFWDLLPCLGSTTVLLSLCAGGSSVNTLLSCRPMAGIGRISYSLYLWHWPILAFHRYLSIGHPSAWTTLACIAVTFPIAYLSFVFVEQPARNSSTAIKRPTVFTAAAVSIVLMAGIGIYLVQSGGLPQRFSPAVAQLSAVKTHNRILENFDDLWRKVTNPVKPHDARDLPPYILWGDSHAGAIAEELRAIAASHGQALMCFSKGSTPPIAGLAFSNQGVVDDGRYNESILETIESNVGITTVILAARWSCYLRGIDEEFHTRISVLDPDSGSDRHKSAHELIEGQLRFTVDRLLKSGKRVFLVYPIPDQDINIPHVLAMLKNRGIDPQTYVIPEGQYGERQGEMIGILDRITGDRVFRIYPDRILRSHDHFVVGNSSESYYSDDNHLSPAGAVFVGAAFAEIFSEH